MGNFKILLIRHGYSAGQEELALYQRTADNTIGLTDKGRLQARLAGEWLNGHLTAEKNHHTENFKTRIYCSPYSRAQETAGIILQQNEDHFEKTKNRRTGKEEIRIYTEDA